MAAPLDKNQKRILSQLAQRAWNREAAMARARGHTLTEPIDNYRHRHVAQACGKLGLRCCSQDDYGAVKGHFLDLLGEHTQAFQAVHRGEGNGRRVAEFKLVDACKTAGVDITYADRICRTQFRCTIEEASERQLWCLVFTLRNRRKASSPKPRAIFMPQPELVHAN